MLLLPYLLGMLLVSCIRNSQRPTHFYLSPAQELTEVSEMQYQYILFNLNPVLHVLCRAVLTFPILSFTRACKCLCPSLPNEISKLLVEFLKKFLAF